MRKKTSVELLWQEVNEIINDSQYEYLVGKYEQILALEKQQIIDAANNGCKSMCNIDTERDGEDYYTQTYKD